jgi:hypothetical protein
MVIDGPYNEDAKQQIKIAQEMRMALLNDMMTVNGDTYIPPASINEKRLVHEILNSFEATAHRTTEMTLKSTDTANNANIAAVSASLLEELTKAREQNLSENTRINSRIKPDYIVRQCSVPGDTDIHPPKLEKSDFIIEVDDV